MIWPRRLSVHRHQAPFTFALLHQTMNTSRLNRRLVLKTSLTSLVVPGWLAAPAQSQVLPKAAGNYPDQPIRFVSPFPPGGGNDFHARLVANELANVTGQTAIVENRGGAGGNLGTKSVADLKGDGYTVLTSQVSIMAINPVLYKSAGFDPVRQFMPITQINAAPLAIVVRSESPLRSMADMRALSQSTPGGLTFATPGNGTLSHLVGVALEKEGQIALTHVPYKGAAPALSDLLGGQVHLMITSTSSVAGQIQQGKLRALAVTSSRRVGVFKSVPTLEDAGFKDMVFDDWYGFFVPAGTPPERVAYLNRAITTVLRSPSVTQKIIDAGSEVVANSADELTLQLQQDMARWGRVVKLSGATID